MKSKFYLFGAMFICTLTAMAQPFQAYRLKAGSIFKNNVFTDGPDSLAQFQGPARMVSLGDSVIFVADQDNNRIRRISISTKRTTTIAGDGRVLRKDSIGVLASLNKPKALCLRGDSVLYFTESGSHSLRKINLATLKVTTVIGGASGFVNGNAQTARLNDPRGMVFRGDSVMYLADAGNNRIRKISFSPQISVTTFAGRGPNNYIPKDSLDKDSINFGEPRGLCIVSNKLVIVENDYNHPVVRYIDFGNNIVYNMAGGDRPEDVIPYNGDTVLVTEAGGSAKIRLRIAGQLNYDKILAPFNCEGIVKIGNRIYISSPQTATLFTMALNAPTNPTRFTGLGRSTDGGAGRARFGELGGFAYKNEWLYYNDITTNRIRKFNTVTFVTQTVTRGGRGDNGNGGKASLATARFNEIAEMKFGPDGKLYVLDAGNTQIRVVDEAQDSVFLVSGSRTSGYINGTLQQARYSNLSSFQFYNGKWYLAEGGNAARIRIVDPVSNTVTTLAGCAEGVTGNGLIDTTGTLARFSFNIGGLLVRGDTLYVLDRLNKRLRGVVLATGKVITAAGNDSYDNLPFAFLDKTNSLLMRFNGAQNSFIRVASKNGPWPVVLGAQQSGNVDGLGTAARFNNVGSAVLDTVSGDVFMADRNNQSFRRIEYLLFNQAPLITGPTPANYVVNTINPVSVPAFLTLSPGPAWEASQTLNVYSVTSSNNALFTVPPTIGIDGSLNLTASGTNGVSNIKVFVRDNGGLANNGNDSASYSFTITANIVSNKDRISQSGLTVFPNPSANGNFYFSLSENKKLKGIEILDVAGKLIEKHNPESAHGSIQLKSKGLFLFRFTYSDGFVETRKLENR